MDTENSCFEKEDWEAKEKDDVLFELKEKLGKSSAQFIFPPPREGWDLQLKVQHFYTFITSGGMKLPALTWANWST